MWKTKFQHRNHNKTLFFIYIYIRFIMGQKSFNFWEKCFLPFPPKKAPNSQYLFFFFLFFYSFMQKINVRGGALKPIKKNFTSLLMKILVVILKYTCHAAREIAKKNCKIKRTIFLSIVEGICFFRALFISRRIFTLG